MLKNTVALGGTFNSIHKGHIALIEKALEFKDVRIGLTSDEFVRSSKGVLVKSYDERREQLEKALGMAVHKCRISKIDSAYGFAAIERDLETIIVSSETFAVAQEINLLRQSSGMKPLRIIKIPLLYGQDLKKISSSAIQEGKIDAQGQRLKPLLICLASENPNKLEGVGIAFREMLGLQASVSGKKAQTFSKQPLDRETVESAIDRAKQVWDNSLDYSVGIESGIMSWGDHSLDMAFAAIYDGEEITLGNSMGFGLPSEIVHKIHMGSELGDVIDSLAGTKQIGRKEGAISFLSSGKLKRLEMNIQAVKCALIPRIAKTLLDKEEVV